jgi:hypothetical protein
MAQASALPRGRSLSAAPFSDLAPWILWLRDCARLCVSGKPPHPPNASAAERGEQQGPPARRRLPFQHTLHVAPGAVSRGITFEVDFVGHAPILAERDGTRIPLPTRAITRNETAGGG